MLDIELQTLFRLLREVSESLKQQAVASEEIRIELKKFAFTLTKESGFMSRI